MQESPPKTIDLLFEHLRSGDRVRVLGFKGLEDEYRRQLLSLGMTPGVELLVKHIAPLGDPIEVMMRGFRLSLRRKEAAGIQVERV